MKQDPSNRSPKEIRFATTHWSQVLLAVGDSPNAAIALRELCERYYAPIEAFIGRTTRRPDEARDLAHAFIAKLLEGASLSQARPQSGRFRSYLLGAVKHFLANQLDFERSAKRGGAVSTVSLDTLLTSQEVEGGSLLDNDTFPTDAYFDREWALALLHQTLEGLGFEEEKEGRGPQFKILRSWLTGESQTSTIEETAIHLGCSATATKVAIHRLRKRFRQSIRMQIEVTVRDKSEVKQELDHLIEALSYSDLS